MATRRLGLLEGRPGLPEGRRREVLRQLYAIHHHLVELSLELDEIPSTSRAGYNLRNAAEQVTEARRKMGARKP